MVSTKMYVSPPLILHHLPTSVWSVLPMLALRATPTPTTVARPTYDSSSVTVAVVSLLLLLQTVTLVLVSLLLLYEASVGSPTLVGISTTVLPSAMVAVV